MRETPSSDNSITIRLSRHTLTLAAVLLLVLLLIGAAGFLFPASIGSTAPDLGRTAEVSPTPETSEALLVTTRPTDVASVPTVRPTEAASPVPTAPGLPITVVAAVAAAQPSPLPHFTVSPAVAMADSPVPAATIPTFPTSEAAAAAPSAAVALAPRTASTTHHAVASAGDPPPAATRTPQRGRPLKGNVHWVAAATPVVLRENTLVPPNALLLIDPGVEVQLDPGVSLIVQGTLVASGTANQHVRFVAHTPGTHWEALVVDPNGQLALSYTDLLGGGAGGKVLQSTAGRLTLSSVGIHDGTGQLWAQNSVVQIQGLDMANNQLAYGAAVELIYTALGRDAINATVADSAIAGAQLADGAPALAVYNRTPAGVVNLDIERNALEGQSGPDLDLLANGPLTGTVSCNKLTGGANGVSIHSETRAPTFRLDLKIEQNAITKHAPGNNQTYQQLSIGRGATSELLADLTQNWWGNPAGPYAPDRNRSGLGDAVGVNIAFDGWLSAWPPCAPAEN